MEEYRVRRFRPADRDGFFSLYEAVFSERKSDDWFEWKYESNPYTDHIPIIVTVHEGHIVGARSFFALPLAWDGHRDTVLQPCDSMVHPDHRQQGIFTQMTETAIEQFRGSYPFFFNFPNEQSLPGNLKLGWRTVSQRNSYLRIENPKRLLQQSSNSLPTKFVGSVGTLLARSYYGLQNRRSRPSGRIDVRKEAEVPVSELAALYEAAVPTKIHAVRDETFLRWRWQNPDWEYTTYIAEEDGDPKAAVVVGRPRHTEIRTVKFTDVIPPENAPAAALRALCGQILADCPETDLYTAPPQGIPESVIRDFGFVSVATFPLSYFADGSTHVVRTLTGNWNQYGRDISQSDNWLLTFAEMDVA